MSVPPEVFHVVRQWVEKAEQDLVVTDRLLAEGNARLAEVVCFHAQQCVEKYVKSILALNDIDPPKTHDIESIIDQLADPRAVSLSVAERRRLTKYATVTYPGDHDPITLEEAQRAVEIARRARTELRCLLPVQATGQAKQS
jgi:HEPN domain-containing protein